jgi:RNA polymerase sigma-70 factor (ECF subfamily)
VFGIAYRMLHSSYDAEDIAQEVWLRWQTLDLGSVREPGALLATMTARLVLNHIGSATVRRELGVGDMYEESVSYTPDPTAALSMREDLSAAIELLVSRLTPTERAAFILREALGYPYTRIGEVVGSTPTAARQLVSRARRRMSSASARSASAAGSGRFAETVIVALAHDEPREIEAAVTAGLSEIRRRTVRRASSAPDPQPRACPSAPSRSMSSRREETPSFA